MIKSHYGYYIIGQFYCRLCPIPAVAGSGNREASVEDANKRCCICAKTLREVVEDLDQKDGE